MVVLGSEGGPIRDFFPYLPNFPSCCYILFTEDYRLKKKSWGFPGGTVVENLPANAGDTGSSPGLGRSHMPRSN